jgi:hypothetical protein
MHPAGEARSSRFPPRQSGARLVCAAVAGLVLLVLGGCGTAASDTQTARDQPAIGPGVVNQEAQLQASPCWSIFGGGVVAAACAPSAESPTPPGAPTPSPTFAFVFPQASVRVGGRAGVAQAGGPPLGPDDRFVFAGTAPPDTELLVRAMDTPWAAQARFGNLGIDHQQRAELEVLGHGPTLSFRLVLASGRVINPLAVDRVQMPR